MHRGKRHQRAITRTLMSFALYSEAGTSLTKPFFMSEIVRLKMQDRKMTDRKMTDKSAGLENAGLENDGQKCSVRI